MASPAVVARSGGGVTTADTSLGVTVGQTTGNLYIIFARWSSPVTGITIDANSGGPGAFFTEFTPAVNDASDDTATCWYRFYDGTETASTVVFLWTGSSKMAFQYYSISGAADPATQPPEATAQAGATANADPLAITPTGGAKDYLFLVNLGMDTETASATAPTNYGSQLSFSSGTGGSVASNCRIWSAERALNAASENPGPFTSSAPNSGWTTFTVAVHPAGAGGAAHSRSPADTVALADARTRTIAFARSLADAVAMADAFSRTRTASKTLADSIALADARTIASAKARTITETAVALTDSTTRQKGKQSLLADSVVLADAFSRSMAKARSLADPLALADALSRVATRSRTAADTVTLADSASPVLTPGVPPTGFRREIIVHV